MAIKDWFAGRPTISPAVTAALADLANLSKIQPSLAASCAVLEEILPILFGDATREPGPTLDAKLARDKLAAGIPLLRGEKLNLDAQSLRRRWLAVCKAVGRQNADAKKVAAAFGDLDPCALLVEAIAGRPEAVHARAEALHLDAALTATVLRLTVFPVLVAWSAALTPLLRACRWDRGHCPVCGSWPLLAELRGLEQLRVLRCGLCAAEWEFPRLRCPFCGINDHRQLGFLHVEGQENRYRAATCESCRGYVKTASTLAALSAPQVLVTDLATLPLDLIAADRGYFVPSSGDSAAATPE